MIKLFIIDDSALVRNEFKKIFAPIADIEVIGSAPNPVDAFDKALKEIPNAVKIQQMVKAGLESRSENTRETIVKFGQMCSVQAALPSTIHLIVKYEDNLKEALIENIMAGGDSSARGMLAGFILGCYQGLETIPKQWLDDMTAYEKIIHKIKNKS